MGNRNSPDGHIRVAVNRPVSGNLMDIHGESLFAQALGAFNTPRRGQQHLTHAATRQALEQRVALEAAR